MDNIELKEDEVMEDKENHLKIFTKEHTNAKTGAKFNTYFGVDGEFTIKVEFSKKAREAIIALNLPTKVYDLTFLDSQHFIKDDVFEDENGNEKKVLVCVITDFVKATPSVMKSRHMSDLSR